MEEAGSTFSQDEINNLFGGGASSTTSSAPSNAEPPLASILGQSEIDQLLQSASQPASSVIDKPKEKPLNACVFSAAGKRMSLDLERIKKFDFKQPMFFTEIELDQLKQRYELWLRSLSARLSMLLRMDFSLNLLNFNLVSYGKFLDTIPTPAHLILFKVDKLNGMGLLYINVNLAMTIINRMLGGKAHSVPDERFLTEIEVALMDEIVQVFLEEWCNIWKGWVGDLSFEKVGVENSPRFIRNTEANFSLLTIDVEGALGDCVNKIQLALPCGMMQPIVQKLKERKKAVTLKENTSAKWIWRNAYESIHVPVTAEWKAGTYPVKKLVELKSGEMIKLPTEILRQTLVNVQGSYKFIGEVGLQKGQVAVKILKKCSKND